MPDLETLNQELNDMIIHKNIWTVEIDESYETYCDELNPDDPLNGSSMYYGNIENIETGEILELDIGTYCDVMSVYDELKEAIVKGRY